MSTSQKSEIPPEPVPQMALAAQYAAIGGEIRVAMDNVLSSQQFALGKEGAALEREISQLCGVAHGVGVASGTDALILALRACDVHASDEVILPPFTFVATGSAVSALGATPVFADIRPDTYNLDPAQLERRITPKTRAIVVVHLYGLAADPLTSTVSPSGISGMVALASDEPQRTPSARSRKYPAPKRNVRSVRFPSCSWCPLW